MAKTTDTIPIWLGSKQNRKQGIVAIPAEATAHKSGLLFLEAVDSGGTIQDGLYLWARSDDTLAYDTSVPSDEATSGTTIGTSAASTAALLANVTVDHVLMKADGVARALQNTAIVVDDSNNVSAMGTLACNGITIANGHGLDLQEDITFGGATGVDLINVPDNLADALNLKDATGNSYIKVVSTTSAPGVTVGQNLTLSDITALGTTASLFLVSDSGEVKSRSGAQVRADSGSAASGSNSDITAASGFTGNISTPVNLTMTGNISGVVNIASMTGSIATPTNITMSGALSGATTMTCTSHVTLDGDDVELRIGDDGATDSKIWFDAVALRFYDAATAAAKPGGYTLNELATGTTLNPTVTGNLTISDGDFDWTNSATSESATWDLGATTVDAIDIIADTTDAKAIHLIANSATSGSLLYLQAVDTTMTTGEYIDCFDGTNEVFTVKRYGATTIFGNAATTVFTITDGDAVISDGSLAITDSDNATSFSVTNNTITDTGNLCLLSSTSQTSGVALYIDLNAGSAGKFISCDNGGELMYVDNDDGNIVVAGTDGSSAYTATAGNIALTDGIISATTDGNLGHTFASTADAAGSATDLVTISNSNAAFDNSLLVITGAMNGAYDAMQITYAGTENALDIVGSAAAGTAIYAAGPAGQTDSLVKIDGATGAGWDGAANVGMLHVNGLGAHADVAASLLLISDITGASIGSGRGTSLRIVDATTVGADSWVAYIATTANDGLLIENGHVDGKALWLKNSTAGVERALHVDGTTGSWVGNTDVGLVDIDGDGVLVAGANLLRIESSGANTAQSHLLEIVASGAYTNSTDGTALRITDTGAVAGTSYAAYIESTANNGLEIQTAAAAATNLVLTGSSGQTASMLSVDGTPTNGFVGASGVGMAHFKGDGTLAQTDAATMLINYTGTTASGAEGSNLRIIDGGTSGGGTSYSVYIDAGTNMEALKINSGKVLVTETVTATGGFINPNADTDIHDTTPTNANFDAASGSTPAAVGDGWIGICDDNGAHTAVWLYASDGTEWHYVALTKAN